MTQSIWHGYGVDRDTMLQDISKLKSISRGIVRFVWQDGSSSEVAVDHDMATINASAMLNQLLDNDELHKIMNDHSGQAFCMHIELKGGGAVCMDAGFFTHEEPDLYDYFSQDTKTSLDIEYFCGGAKAFNAVIDMDFTDGYVAADDFFTDMKSAFSLADPNV